MTDHLVEEFIHRNQAALRVLGIDLKAITTISVERSLGITQEALQQDLGKFRNLEQLAHMDSVVRDNFQHPLISSGREGRNGKSYRQTSPLVSLVGLPLGEDFQLELSLGTDTVTRVMSAAAKIALREDFVTANPGLFFDKTRKALWSMMQEQGITIPEKLLQSPTLFSRFDGVVGQEGRIWLVDATFQSGGVDVVGLTTERWEQLVQAGPYWYDLDWKQAAQNLSLGLEEQSMVILGGSQVRGYAPDRLRDAGVPVSGVIPTRPESGLESLFPGLEEGQFSMNSQGLHVPDHGVRNCSSVAFWWGSEHVTTPLLRGRYLAVLQGIAEEKVSALNHPIPMAVVESKATLALLALPGALRELVEAELGNQLVKDALGFVPARTLLRLETQGTKLLIQKALETLWNREVHWETLEVFDGTQASTRRVLKKLGVFNAMLKPTAGLGAHGIQELSVEQIETTTEVLQQLVGPKEAFYVLEPLVAGLRLNVPNVLTTAETGQLAFTGPELVRWEVYTSTFRDSWKGTETIAADLSKVLGLIVPGKPDSKIHAASGCITIPIGLV